MFNSKIKTRQPFASQFLESALTPGLEKLANSYLLAGTNTLDMYLLAAETARILNCETKTANCACTSCEWIRQNRHPAFITISPIDYIHPNKDGKPKTVVTINQALELKNTLAVSSRYHRVVVFTNAAEGKECAVKAEMMWDGFTDLIAPPVLQNSDAERENWIPLPLNYKTFHSEPANALLKTIEEPPPGVTFFFLTRDREDMIDTIVSRSQIVPLVYNPQKPQNFDFIERFFSVYPPKSKDQAIAFAERLMEQAKEHSMSLDNLLDLIEDHLVMLVKQRSTDTEFCRRSVEMLKNLQQAKGELKSYVNPQSVIDSLMVNSV